MGPCCCFTKQQKSYLPHPSPLSYDQYSDEVIIDQVNLYPVKQEQMNHPAYKHIVALVANIKNSSHKLRGSGLLISPNLILTCRHNFFKNGVRIQNSYFKVYISPSGVMLNPYFIQSTFVPKNDLNDKSFDYALIKLTKQVDAKDFVHLNGNFKGSQEKENMGIFGYPAMQYSTNDKSGQSESVQLFGLEMVGKVVEVREHQILHKISTLPGQSGSPLMLIKNEKRSVVGIHLGGIKTKINDQIESLNVGRLITQDLIDILKKQAIKLKAKAFNTVQKQKQQIINKKLPLKHNLGSKKLQQKSVNEVKSNGIFLNVEQDYAKIGSKPIKDNKINQNSNLSLINLGKVLQQQHNYRQAAIYYRKSIQKNNCDPAFYQLGKALQDQNKWKQAIIYYKKCKESNPQSQTSSNIGGINIPTISEYPNKHLSVGSSQFLAMAKLIKQQNNMI